MSLYQELAVDQDIEIIKGIQFTLMSPDEIQKRSVAEITSTNTFDINEPVIGGLFDPRMGVIEHNKKCCTCEQKNTFCPGHFGHINLARAVFYIQFFDTVRKTMTCICYRCSRVLVDLEKKYEDKELSRKAPRQKRFEQVYKAVKKGAVCAHCTTVQPNKILKDNNGFLTLVWKDAKDKPVAEGAAAEAAPVEGEENKLNMYADDVLPILTRINDADAEALGFNKALNRPEWMICTVFPVPPPSVRPSVRNDTGQRSEDDLTHKLCDIVKTNNILKACIEKDTGNGKIQIDSQTALLQYHVSTFVDNQVPGLNPSKHRTGRPFRVLRERLKGKEGRIRGNLMGKRVDFSARSVITPDPNISIDELGVPFKIAMNLTVPEIVNAYNFDDLVKCVNNGPSVYPGAKFVRKASEQFRVVALKKADPNLVLEMGDVVDRHMRDGDYVLFNRQPSLHKMSMMGHRIRVMPYDTFRLNVCVTPSFNADFDGDEMNAHGPQSVQTENELIQLSAVPTQIISPRDSKPIISVVQDIATGVYRLTKPHIRITEKQFFNLLANTSKFNGQIPKALHSDHGQPMWSGQQILGSILPSSLNVRMGNSSYDSSKAGGDQSNFVIIENGVFKQGTVDKTIYQDRTNGLVHTVFNDNGTDEARLLFDNTQRIVCDWLVQTGFSVGISDLVIDQSTAEAIKDVVNGMKRQAYEMIRTIHAGNFKNRSIMSPAEFFEEEINGLLNKAREEASKIGLKTITDDNRMLNMIRSKSKGSTVNVAQMIAALGQQNVEGKRIPYGYDDRTLPHYTRYDDGPDARGFVENSFIKGLTPQEFFFHAMGGREGLIDTAVKSVTGDTPIVVLEGGVCKYVKIGDWIDGHLDDKANSEDIAYFDERNMEYFPLKQETYIPTMDDDGNMTWGEMTAVTRHDPGTELYEIETEGGRKVIVTESKSLLIWNENKQQFLQKPTPEVVVGDFVPVTMNLPTPPVVIRSVDMSQYFPKTEYLYGTDFHKAVRMINETMELVKAGGGDKIPCGWWEKHNGTSFTTPYTCKAHLTRVTSGRSAIDNIKEGCFYPFHINRSCGNLPAEFELNYENGVFIGIYLADGCTSFSAGSVGITKEDQGVKDWVTNWFTKYNIKSKIRIEHREADESRGVVAGTIHDTVGYSRILGVFLDQFVGHGACNKHVPDVAFVAPEEFVLGVLGGYFSGDGSMTTNSVSSNSISRRLTEGISMLCSRIGIFTKISVVKQKKNNLGTKNIAPSHVISIRAQWATLFAAKIKLIVGYKQECLDNMNAIKVHCNYPVHHDVVKDAIKKINIIDVAEYPSVYDVTVPSTLNFGLANGLQCQDTSDVGYVQRKLVKAMEDCKIAHDLTVRNASGAIVQFLYGEDGMSATKLEAQVLSYVDMDPVQLEAEYLMSAKDSLVHVLDEPTLAEFNQEANYERLAEYFVDVLEDREYMISRVFQNKYEKRVMYPISMSRILRNTEALFHTKDIRVPSDLSPMFVLDCIDALEEELFLSKNNKGTKLFGILLRAYLSPKVLLYKYRFGRLAFEHIIKEIKVKFYEAIAHPSEMVGVVAAQSIGEPSTQLSAQKGTLVLICHPDESMSKETIGSFVDTLLAADPAAVKTLGPDSVVMDLPPGYKIIGVSNDEKTSWKNISQISRHPANGGMVRVHTDSGKKTCATLSHSFLKRTESGIEPVLGSALKIGDRIPVAKYIPTIENPYGVVELGDSTFELDREFGWICGAYIADGSVSGNEIKISKIIPEYYERVIAFAHKIGSKPTQYRKKPHKIKYNKSNPDKLYEGLDTIFTHKDLAPFLAEQFGNGSYNKKVGAFVYASNLEFIKGVIGGYFDGDGNVADVDGKGMIRTGSVSEKLTEDMIQLLAYVGLFGSKCLEVRKEEERGDLHTIQVPRKYAQQFKDDIGFVVKVKAEDLDKVIAYNNRENIHSKHEYIDKIPELGHVIAYIGKALELPGQSRNYRRWIKKESIGRSTLLKYIDVFETANAETKDAEVQKTVAAKIAVLKQAAFSDVIWDEITQLEYLEDPQEFVYDFTVPGNDSFMVDCNVLVHNTLNSVEWNTDLLLRDKSGVRRVTIGEFIDDNIKTNTKIEDHPHDTKLGWIQELDVHVLSCDTQGIVDWKLVEAVTRHPVVNEDGSNTLLKVTTASGREVTATKAKSFLKRVNNQIIGVRGDELKVGDYLPVSTVLPLPKSQTSWNTLPDLTQRIPVEFFQASRELLMDAVAAFDYTPSVNKGLLEDIQQILTIVGVKSHIVKVSDSTYVLKQGLNDDLIPNVVTVQHGDIPIRRNAIDHYACECTNADDQAVFDAIKAETIFYDKVVSIQEVPNPTPYVYDLTVADTRNFNLYNGLAMRDTFHSSGISAASKTVRGVPRLKELLSVSKNIKTPALTIYLKTDPGVSASTEAIDGDPARAAQRRCDAVLKDLKTTHIRDIIKSSSIYFNPSDIDTDIGDDKDFIKMYKLFGDAMCESTDKSPWLLRLEFDKTKMSDEGLLMEDVHFALETFYDRQIHCMFSDDNAKELVFRIRLADLRKADAAQANSDDVITELKALEQNVLENVIVRGVRGIQNAQMTLINTQRFNSAGSVFEKASEWVIGTYGTNLMTVLGLPEVDCVRTVSNDVHEIYHTLGIEAARMCLINEINECLADVGVNYRHIALLADVMTYKGALLSIDRHGINRSDIGPLAKCSFEETSDMLIKAGMFAEYDPVNGVSANIMLGQVPPCGTGDTTIMIDEDKLRNIHAIKTPIIEKTWADIDEEDNVCTMEGLSFDFKLNGL